MARQWVVNCKRDEYDIYIGRPGPWGNPFIVGTHGTRAQCCALYEEWLAGTRKAPNGERPPSRKAIRKALRGKVLGCWCMPQQCHGLTLSRIANTVPTKGLFSRLRT